jgi:outer membrane protein assembly factor BamB
VFQDNRVFLAVGQDPEHGEGPGQLHCIDATKTGDITESGKVWNRGGQDFHRTLSTVAVADGLVYASDLSGFLYCLDEKTGQLQKHGSGRGLGLALHGGWQGYAHDEDGEVVFLSARDEGLATNNG